MSDNDKQTADDGQELVLRLEKTATVHGCCRKGRTSTKMKVVQPLVMIIVR